jgi:hypothetical protein
MTHPGWGVGDLFSIGVGLLVLGVCLGFVPRHRNVRSVSAVLASGMSLGPLLLIILDPLAELLGVGLLKIVLEQSRATLWWAAVVASLYVVRDLL